MMTVAQTFDLARQHHQAGRRAEAEGLYRQILAAHPEHAGALQFLGVMAHEAGRPDLAMNWIGRAVALDPTNAAAHANLGETCRARGRLDEAIGSYRRAIQLQPDYTLAYFKLGNALNELNQHGEATAAYRRTIELKPDFTDAHNNLGIALAGLGKFDEAVAAFRRTLELEPNRAEAHTNLGIALGKQGRLDEAIAAYERAIALKPKYPEAWNELGVAMAGQKRFDEAISAFRHALQIKPGSIEVYNNLGHALWRRNRLDEAIAAYRQAIQLQPDYAEAHNNLAIALAANRQLDEAVAEYGEAIRLQPGSAEAHNNLGNVLRDMARLDEAMAAYRRALDFKPDYPQAHSNLGVALTAQGRFDEAFAVYRHALRLNPDNPVIHSNLIYALHFQPGNQSETIAAEEQRWNRQFSDPVSRSVPPHTNRRDPERPLCIGYVSPDFRNHVIGRNILPLFRQHDPRSFKVIGYSGALQSDELTQEFRRHAQDWRSTVGVPDQALAKLIREDGVDILVDLTQHLAGNRLPLFAHRPAPVQVSFAGYPESSGVEAIPYRISDRWLESEMGDRRWEIELTRGAELRTGTYPELAEGTPQSDPALSLRKGTGERLYLIDSFWCYEPCGMDVAVNELPALENGCVTFGCLNSFFKVNEPILTLWARVLAEVRDSRLIVLSACGSHRQRALEVLEQEGIEPHRVEFVVSRPRREYFELYHRLDLALDPFPYNGHTTSLDALWMGVPVVSLAGERAISRAGWSQLSNLDLADLAAFSEDAYVHTAAQLAHDLPRLAELRGTLRSRMEASVLMNAAHFSGQIEAAYRTMWRQWCMEKSP